MTDVEVFTSVVTAVASPQPGVVVEAVVSSTVAVEPVVTTPKVVEVTVRGEQGPGNVAVGPVNTLTPGTPGVWFQTGLGPSGEDFTMWIEDGR